jgi:hypothetical protein
MFENYNTFLEYPLILDSPSEVENHNSGATKLLYNKKGQFYGVEAKYLMPFSLYFHLTEASNQDITSMICESVVEFSIYSKPSYKPLIQKTLLGKEIFNSTAQDLKIDINQEEAQRLSQETYYLELKLNYPSGYYILHSEQDGLLVIR